MLRAATDLGAMPVFSIWAGPGVGTCPFDSAIREIAHNQQAFPTPHYIIGSEAVHREWAMNDRIIVSACAVLH